MGVVPVRLQPNPEHDARKTRGVPAPDEQVHRSLQAPKPGLRAASPSSSTTSEASESGLVVCNESAPTIWKTGRPNDRIFIKVGGDWVAGRIDMVHSNGKESGMYVALHPSARQVPSERSVWVPKRMVQHVIEPVTQDGPGSQSRYNRHLDPARWSAGGGVVALLPPLSTQLRFHAAGLINERQSLGQPPHLEKRDD